MVKVILTGKTLVIQNSRRERPTVETYVSGRALLHRIDEMHLRGQITNKRHQHLVDVVNRSTELNMSGKR